MRRLWWWAALAVVGTACKRAPTEATPTASAAPPATTTYLDRLARFKTTLVRRGPSFQPYEPGERAPTGVREVIYESDGMQLKAWLALPAGGKLPAVVFFHGGFAFGKEDYEMARPFLDAGLALLCPMLRGENGNPGDMEMYLGEVRDAKAAVRWLASQPEIDASRIYTFGHSAGGIVSSLLALHDVPVRHGGSAGGMYGVEIFEMMAEAVPFSRDNPEESALRVLLGNARWMRRPHYAYMGADDRPQNFAQAREEAAASRGLLQAKVLPGDHFTSFEASANEYIKIIQSAP